jgi:8-oxo-dGTP pyrophosphatase MutT (NUDIX family)
MEDKKKNTQKEIFLNTNKNLNNNEIIQANIKKNNINESNVDENNVDENNINENNIPINYNKFSNFNEYQNLYCLNCGKKGHINKKCLQPVISLGIICIRLNISLDINDIINYSKKIQNNYLFSLDEINKLKKIKYTISNLDLNKFDDIIEYLFIRRKNSLNYVEFMRGKYDLENINYLENILNLISTEEKELLLKNDFEILWNTLWEFNKKKNNNNIEYKNSETKFNLLKKGFITKKNEINIYTDLESILKNSIFNYKYPEWGFPKGRRNLKEKNIDCAKREFNEETSLCDEDYHILNMSPLEEIYLSTNNSKYKHIYYISQSNNKDKNILLDNENINQKIEIGDIKWVNFNDSFDLIRDYNIEKKILMYSLHNTLKSTIINFKDILKNFLEFL